MTDAHHLYSIIVLKQPACYNMFQYHRWQTSIIYTVSFFSKRPASYNCGFHLNNNNSRGKQVSAKPIAFILWLVFLITFNRLAKINAQSQIIMFWWPKTGNVLKQNRTQNLTEQGEPARKDSGNEYSVCFLSDIY